MIKQLFSSSLLGPQAYCQMPLIHVLGGDNQIHIYTKEVIFLQIPPKKLQHIMSGILCAFSYLEERSALYNGKLSNMLQN